MIYTIGHSNHQFEHLIALLHQHAIEVLVDVRSAPYSRYAVQFNSQALRAALPAAGVKYLYLGRELGGRPDGREFYDADGYVLYGRVARSGRFLEGISRLERGSQQYRVALMCSEEDPAGCHRRLLVGRVLAERGLEVRHIRGDGAVQTEADVARAEHERRGDGGQLPLFAGAEEAEWKSIRSVLRSEAPPTSSAP